jgi:hypothetical protein
MLTAEPVEDAADETPAAGDTLAVPLADELDELDELEELHAATSTAPASMTADSRRVFGIAGPYLSVNRFPRGTGQCKAGIAPWYSNAVMPLLPCNGRRRSLLSESAFRRQNNPQYVHMIDP